MQEYKTKQKEILLDCLRSNKDVHLTANEISAADIQKNRAGNGAVYIYGRYFDEESGVKILFSKKSKKD